jgi:hypothetical protein
MRRSEVVHNVSSRVLVSPRAAEVLDIGQCDGLDPTGWCGDTFNAYSGCLPFATGAWVRLSWHRCFVDFFSAFRKSLVEYRNKTQIASVQFHLEPLYVPHPLRNMAQSQDGSFL